MSTFVVVDVESDGEYPDTLTGYSMVCFGAVVVEKGLSKTFFGKTKPISGNFKPEALAISGYSREEHESFDDPRAVMISFKDWLSENVAGKPVFISDNIAYDWSFINWYFHKFIGHNPFGYSGRRIGDLWCGFNNDLYLRWKWMRETKHTHNPVDDALGNAEAMIKMQDRGLKLGIK